MAKRPNRDQLLMEDMFDEASLRRIKEEMEGDAFESVDESIETDYRCPHCGYEWSGQAKPTGSDLELAE